MNGSVITGHELSPEEDIIVNISRAGFKNEAEATAAGFLERKANGGYHIDWTKVSDWVKVRQEG